MPEVDSFRVLGRFAAPDADVVLGWGRRPTTHRARRFAQRWNLPFVSLEDGFLRSWGLPCHGYRTHSIVVDSRGIYYDARTPSDLETLIHKRRYGPDELAQARRGIELIRKHRLSKYNHGPDRPLEPSDRRRVLVVDQTRGDASIPGARSPEAEGKVERRIRDGWVGCSPYRQHWNDLGEFQAATDRAVETLMARR